MRERSTRTFSWLAEHHVGALEIIFYTVAAHGPGQIRVGESQQVVQVLGLGDIIGELCAEPLAYLPGRLAPEHGNGGIGQLAVPVRR